MGWGLGLGQLHAQGEGKGWGMGRVRAERGGHVVGFGSLCTNALHLCCHYGKQMPQRCLKLCVRWLDVLQRDQTLALSAHHFDLHPVKPCGESIHLQATAGCSPRPRQQHQSLQTTLSG